MDKEYMRQYMKRRYWERRELGISLLGGKCSTCGSDVGLEFDHVDPSTKTMSPDRMTKVSMPRFMEELEKCQLLCDSCHNTKSIGEKGHKIAAGTHGTLSSYRYCKCAECRAANSKWQKEYKIRRRTTSGSGPDS